MAEVCERIGCPEVVRLALQDPCTGEPIPGPANGAVLRCTRNATLEKVLRDEEVSEFVADCGPADRYVQEPQLQGYNLSFEIAQFSPETEALLTGAAVLANGSQNVGVLYEAELGCRTLKQTPRFIAEVFFQRRGVCGEGVQTNYLRYVIPSIRFNPTEIDAEGQIRFTRFSGTSDPAQLSGITEVNAGPYNDLPAGIVADLEAFAPETTTYGFWFHDPIEDPVGNLVLAEGTCYTAEVPVAQS